MGLQRVIHNWVTFIFLESKRSKGPWILPVRTLFTIRTEMGRWVTAQSRTVQAWTISGPCRYPTLTPALDQKFKHPSKKNVASWPQSPPFLFLHSIRPSLPPKEISKLIFAYPLILQKKKKRKRKKRKEDKSYPTLDNGACQHLSVEHIIFSFWQAYGKR